jgi:hypothetical protein
MYSTPQYFEKRIEALEKKVYELQAKLEKLYAYKLVSDRHIDAIDRRYNDIEKYNDLS